MIKNIVFILLFFISVGATFIKIESTPFVFPNLQHFPELKQQVNTLTEEKIELGRYLYYDSILSIDYSLSCASCHQQKFAFSDGGKDFSLGINNQPLSRNTPALFNLAWQSHFFWDGKATSLQQQAFFPVSAHNEMNLSWDSATVRVSESEFYSTQFLKAYGNQTIDSNLIVDAIAQFELSILSYNSKYDSVVRGETYFTALEYRGFEIANDQSMGDCLHCHTTDGNGLGTTGNFSNNGIDSVYKDLGLMSITNKKEDLGKFKIPSFRNVGLTAPYMHDGRFKSLEEVIDFYSTGVKTSSTIDNKMQYAHRGGVQLNSEDKKALVAFLHTLSDSVLIRNTNYSNPFLPSISK